jgi:ATP-binding cassette, subfamily C, bacteriocin exporter
MTFTDPNRQRLSLRTLGIRRFARGLLKTNVVRQFDQIDCGPAALLTILRYHGGDAPASELRELAATDAHGTSFMGLARAAKAVGLDVEGVTAELNDLADNLLPCIAHLRLPSGLDHYVVIFRVGRRTLSVGDPAEGKRTISRAEFEKLWASRAVLLLQPTAEITAKARVSLFAWLIIHFTEAETWLVQCFFAGLLYAGFGLAASFCVQVLIDRFIPAHDVPRVLVLGAIFLALSASRSAVGLLRQTFLLSLSREVNTSIAQQFIGRVFRLPLSFFETRTKGDIAARLNDANRIQIAILRILGSSLTDLLTIAGALFYIGLFATPLFSLTLASVVVYSILMVWATSPLQSQQRKVMQSYSALEGAYIDSLNGIHEIRAFNVPVRFEELSGQLFHAFQTNMRAFGVTQARASVYAESVGGMLVLGALIYGAILVTNGAMQLGQMIAAYSLLASTVVPVTGLVDSFIALQGALLAAARLTDLSQSEEERNTGSEIFHLRDGVTIQKLGFVWPRGDSLFKALDLTIPCGQITGLWGVSGSGKSTLVKLLQRLYSPTTGQILLDGIPAEQINLSDYRRRVATVSASTRIFSGTLGDNVLLGRGASEVREPNPASKYSLTDAIHSLGFSEFFARFANGIDTKVGEGGRELSSGERQIVGLLRALLSKPSLLLIDEGLSGLDTDVAALVWHVVREYAQTNAVLLISHDRSLLSRADSVYVVEHGRIVLAASESGTPKQMRMGVNGICEKSCGSDHSTNCSFVKELLSV